MTVAALMMVRDEADIIEATIRHLFENVDRVYVLDNNSRDGTREILEALTDEGWLTILDDPEVGYWQERKMTDLARHAMNDGHTWAVPVDADEFWQAPDGVTLKAFLLGVAPNVQIVRAALFNYVPTSQDPDYATTPFERIGWRQPEPQQKKFGKVAVRLHDTLVIKPGNHAAEYGIRVHAFTMDGLIVRHFPWRTEDQYVRKIRNGIEAMNATDLDRATCAHWRAWADYSDDDIRRHFREWFFEEDPPGQYDLVYDPAVPLPW